MTVAELALAAGRRAVRGVAPAALLLTLACGQRSDDPVLRVMTAALGKGDRVILVRALDSGPATGPREAIAAIVRRGDGRPELRLYEGNGRDLAPAFTTQQGDRFRNLTLEDVTGDGRPEILAFWEGGQLEILQVIARADNGSWATLFQNAGQEIERRYAPGGAVEFWITGRTYEEGPGQPPVYASVVYGWNGKGFAERRR